MQGFPFRCNLIHKNIRLLLTSDHVLHSTHHNETPDLMTAVWVQMDKPLM